MHKVDDRFVSAERLAYWYFRLNGFLTMENFVVHPRLREQPGQKTDADIYGVRFPFRSELDMPDDDWVAGAKTRYVFVEVTCGRCKINGPWKKREKRNIQYVLSSIGAFTPELVDPIADALCANGRFAPTSEQFEIELVSVGKEASDEVLSQYPEVRQILITDMLRFIHRRFSRYRLQKADHSHWDATGHQLWNYFESMHQEDEFSGTLVERLK